MSENDEVFEGQRIYLRILQETDIDDRYLSWFDNESLMKFYTTTKHTFTKEKMVEELNQAEATQTYLYGVFTKETDVCIGNVKIGPINLTHMNSDLVVLIGDPAYHGKGLATEAISVGNTIAFKKFSVRKLFGGMYESNIASIKAYTRADWVIEGKLKGHYLVDGKVEDRVLVACFNKEFFKDND